MTQDKFTQVFGTIAAPLEGAWSGAVAAAVIRGVLTEEEGTQVCMEAKSAFEAAIKEWPDTGPQDMGWMPGNTVAVIDANLFEGVKVGECVPDEVLSTLGLDPKAFSVQNKTA